MDSVALGVAPTMALRLVHNAWLAPDLILISFHLGMYLNSGLGCTITDQYRRFRF